MTDPYCFDGRTAVVTGAASGIGAALATALAEQGCHLTLTDINADGLVSIADNLRTSDQRVTTSCFDIGDREAVRRFAGEVQEAHGGLDLLFNNAGVATIGSFEQIAEDDFDWLLNINLGGPIRMTRALLPLLRQSDDAHLINISSIFGVIAPPGQTAYSASKFGLLGFSDALRHELDGTSVGVTTVHPGGVNTNIAASSRAPASASEQEVQELLEGVQPKLIMPPAEAAECILENVRKRRPRVFVGGDARRMGLLQRLFPVHYWWWMRKLYDTDSVMLKDS